MLVHFSDATSWCQQQQHQQQAAMNRHIHSLQAINRTSIPSSLPSSTPRTSASSPLLSRNLCCGSSSQGQIRYELGPYDVLLGRGTGPNENQGNVRFREILKDTMSRHSLPGYAMSKAQIAREVLDRIKANQGSFVRKLSKNETGGVAALVASKTFQDSGSKAAASRQKRHVVYVVVTDAIATEKIKQSIRFQIKAARKDHPTATAVATSGGTTLMSAAAATLAAAAAKSKPETKSLVGLSSCPKQERDPLSAVAPEPTEKKHQAPGDPLLTAMTESQTSDKATDASTPRVSSVLALPAVTAAAAATSNDYYADLINWPSTTTAAARIQAASAVGLLSLQQDTDTTTSARAARLQEALIESRLAKQLLERELAQHHQNQQAAAALVDQQYTQILLRQHFERRRHQQALLENERSAFAALGLPQWSPSSTIPSSSALLSSLAGTNSSPVALSSLETLFMRPEAGSSATTTALSPRQSSSTTTSSSLPPDLAESTLLILQAAQNESSRIPRHYK